MNSMNYPLLFEPQLKERIWGGNKLKEILHKQAEGDNLGESWEISNVPGSSSVVKNGGLKGWTLERLLQEEGEQLLGKRLRQQFGTEFPLLIKYIDARTALSVQLHPGDELAQKRHNSFGKTEMWYIMQAEEGAVINVGFKNTTSKEEYLDFLEKGKITELLNFEQVREGDAVFINTGKVHAIGAGVLLAEIQQTSDITYRIYDWDRTDANGVARELHTDLALEAIDFEKKEDYICSFQKEINTSVNIARCPYFTTNILVVEGELEKDYSVMDSFIIFMCVKGSGSIEVDGQVENIELGQTVLIPAVNKLVRISAEHAELLEVYID